MLKLLNPIMRLVEIPFLLVQKRLGIGMTAWLFLAPNLALFSLFTFLPIILNFSYATTGGEAILLRDRPDVGFQNFGNLLECENVLDPSSCRNDLFWRAVWNTVWFVVFQVGIMVIAALATAIVLNRKIRARGLFRGVFFFPVLLSPVVVALIWKWILQRNGLLNAGLESLGFETINWLIERHWAFFWSTFISIWAHMGFYTLILLAGLQAIPQDVYEAALMDRASPWRCFRRITLPLLSPTLLVVLVLALIKGVQTFDEIYAFTGGGPGSATTLIMQFIYETGFGVQPRLLGVAAAAAIMLAMVLIFLTALQFWINRKKVDG
ncbi:carbohydrate ABC transporter permease [uncultured Roseibium sp.]|uniref:carbohydrate ABC transporter permease n=1 Tax=uncultured Roseibium sp. TaxID=1936171 RepID=UPI00262083EA|nr:sugar ABC transporter permease [uncultured Roseibium sp.]